MNSEQQPSPTAFLQTVSFAVAQLKRQLQRDYELAYPALREIIHLVLDEEEAKAWQLSAFPHLLLPDMVEAHVANLHLPVIETKHENAFVPRGDETLEPAFALCA